MAKGGFGTIEGNGGVLRLPVADDFQEHPGEGQRTARGKALRVRKALAQHPVIGPEHVARAVYQIDLFLVFGHVSTRETEMEADRLPSLHGSDIPATSRR